MSIEECHLDRLHVKMAAGVVAEAVRQPEAGGVFLCGDDDAGERQRVECLVYLLDVGIGKRMMVCEEQCLEMLALPADISRHLLWRGNASEQQHVLP